METKVAEYLEKYEKLSGCTHYDIYFLCRHELYIIEKKELPLEIVKLGRESSSKGGYEKLRLNITSDQKKIWASSGEARKVMSEEKFTELCQQLGYNKGQTCEYLASKARKQDYQLDNVRFDKAGDVNLKRKKIQVKFENASLTQLRTIDKVLAENC